jgi:predicted secreted protein
MPDYNRLIARARPDRLGAVLLFLLLLHLLLLPPAVADARVCSSGCDYSTISDALNASADDDTIVVESGVYGESPIVARRVNLHGLDTGEEKPILIPPQGGRMVLAASGAVLHGFEIAASNADEQSSGGERGTCALEVALPALIYLNDFAGKNAVCAEDQGSWNSTEGINYQFNSRVLRSPLGNYWADYNGTDENNDGIGDQPWILNGKNIDYYPLMHPVDSYRIAGEEETAVQLVRAHVGEPFTITLPSNPTTGYGWTVDYDYVLLKMESDQFKKTATETVRVGAGGFSSFVFTPLLPGKTTIYFVYKRPWENIVADARSFHVEIVA